MPSLGRGPVDVAVTFAALGVTAFAAHQLADHVLGQTAAKAGPSRGPGWAALGPTSPPAAP
jgi:hypothetical protein